MNGYRPVDGTGQPAAAGDVTWSMDADPSTTPLHDGLTNLVLERDVWTDSRGRRRIREGRKFKASSVHHIGFRYSRAFDLVLPGSSPFDIASDVADDMVGEYRSTYQRFHRLQQQLAQIWVERGGEAALLTPLPIKGGVTILSDEEPEDALVGDRWIRGKSRLGPAKVLTENGWIDQEAGPQ